MDAKSDHVSTSRMSPPCRPLPVRRVVSCSAAGKPRRHKVSFSKDVETHGVGRRCDLDDGELHAIWYCSDDFKAMKKQYYPTLKKMAKGIPLGEGDEEPRGLEHKTPQGNKRRHQNRFTSLDAVLQEQDRQWERDRLDPDFIAELYRQSTTHCRLSASKVAEKDEEFVNTFVREKEDETTPLSYVGPEAVPPFQVSETIQPSAQILSAAA